MSFGQTNEIKSSDITSFTYPFNIENNKLIGLGADTLKNVIRESQFFMLGEEHFSPQISELTNVLCIRLSKYMFYNFLKLLGSNSDSLLTGWFPILFRVSVIQV
jgi:hypothetical protein